MSRFHFNVHHIVDEPDLDGTEFPSVEAARVAAIHAAGEIIRDMRQRIVAGENWRMEVSEDCGRVLFRLDFMVVDVSASTGEKAVRV